MFRRKLLPNVVEHFDALLEWAPTSIIAGDEAAKVGLVSREVASDVAACKRQTLPKAEVLSQALSRPRGRSA